MKKEMPTLLFLVAIGLLVFFLYAIFSVSLDVHQTLSTNRSTVSLFADSCLRFIGDNKLILALAAAVVIAVKVLVGSPRTARY